MKTKDRNWTVLFLVVSLWSSGQAQSLEVTYQLAKNAYDMGDHEQAIAYYNRVLFFDRQQAYTFLIYEDLAKSHFELTAYQESAFFYDLSYNTETKSIRKNELLLKRALCYIYLEEYNSALLDLYLIENPPPEQGRQAALLEGMSLYQLDKFEESRVALAGALMADADTVILERNFEQLARINHKSPKKAKIFSMIIPGTGLLYVGDTKNGLSSLLLVGGLATAMVVSSINAGFFNAFLNVFPWYQRYYMGGYQLTERIATQKLDTRRLQHLQKMVKEITSTYSTNTNY